MRVHGDGVGWWEWERLYRETKFFVLDEERIKDRPMHTTLPRQCNHVTWLGRVWRPSSQSRNEGSHEAWTPGGLHWGLHDLFRIVEAHTHHAYVFECVRDVLVDLDGFEPSTSSMPWKPDQSLTDKFFVVSCTYRRPFWTAFGPCDLFHAFPDPPRTP